MISKLKLAAYVALAALAIWFGRAFYSSYTKIAPIATDSPTNSAPAPDAATNTPSTNLSAPAPTATNANRRQTNHPAAQPPAAAATNSEPAAEPPASASPPAANVAHAGSSVRNLILFVCSMVGLGLLITYDLTQYIGAKAGDYLFNDQGEGARDPEYELAEQTWVNGQPLEAIEMMREFLKKNPREQYAALRIAEIYEKDLRNYVAASMEYEEILKKRLPPERWGWAAIHLCNIYSRMGQQDKMKALLERIVKDHPKTVAAKKARRNLGLPDPEGDKAAPAAPPPEPAAEENSQEEHVFDLDQATADGQEIPPVPEAEPEAPSPQQPPKSNLPPGFRKK
jgi:TolA-binding protein